MARASWAVFVAGLVLTASGMARAGDPLSLSATGSSSTINVSGNNVRDLAGDLIEQRGKFASLSGQAVNATLKYGKLENALQLTRNAAGTSATVTIPSTGFTKTYNAANSAQLRSQINEDLKQGGLDTYSKFLGELNEKTAIGTTDGNPLATTAVMADGSYYRFGLIRPAFNFPEVPKGWDVRAWAGYAEADNANGAYVGAGTGLNFELSDRIGLSINLDFVYRDVSGAAVYQLSNVDGLPIRILPLEEGKDGISWTVTPAFAIGGGATWDLAAGGVPVGGQVTSALGYTLGEWTFAWAAQYGYYKGIGINIGDFDYDTDVDQQILKNGLQVIRNFSRDMFVDASLTYTNFIRDAGVDSYWTPDVGLGWRLRSASALRVGYHGDFGNDFTSNGGNVMYMLAW